MDLHIAVDKFYLFYLRRALIFAERKLQTNFIHEKQSLSQILNKKIFLDNFFVVTGKLFCDKKKQLFFGHVKFINTILKLPGYYWPSTEQTLSSRDRINPPTLTLTLCAIYFQTLMNVNPILAKMVELALIK